MKIKFVLGSVLAAIGLLTTQNAVAQTGESTSTERYKGHEYTSVKSTDTNPIVVFLYNVGTGKLLISGGDWGVQARLFYEGLGSGLNLVQETLGGTQCWLFHTGVQTADSQTGSGADVLGCNVNGVTSAGADIKQPIMDANKNYKGYQQGLTPKYRNITFTRVESTTNTETYTYYLSEVLDNTRYYIGGAYGYNSGNNYAVAQSVGDDECAYTTLDVTNSTYAAKDYTIYGNTKVSLQELYQWRIVTLQDIESAIDSQETTDGLSTNVSYRIYDQDFSRNVWSFFDHWQVRVKPGHDYSDDGRYAYTYGFEKTGTNDQGTTIGVNYQDDKYREHWDYPVRLKQQWDTQKSAKYGYMSFEGIGSVSSFITPPAAGYYMVTCKGFYQGNNEAYVFANCVGDPQSATSNRTNLIKSATTYNKSDGTENRSSGTWGAGNTLTLDADGSYDVTLMLKVTPEDISAGRKIYFGVGKDDASKSNAMDGETSGYYIKYGEYYLATTNNSTLSLTTNKDDAIQWIYGATYVSYTQNGTTRYLKYSNGSAVLATGNDGNLARVNTSGNIYYSNGGIFSTTYYLKYNNGSVTFASGTSGNFFETENITLGGYFYDTDWVGVDNFQILFLGNDPVLFDEEEETLDYLKKDDDGNVMESKQYNNQSIRLKREFITGNWNTFVFPLDLTAAQMRGAFGDNMKMAKLVPLGEYTKRADCIDFELVELPASGVAVQGGALYLIKPVKSASYYKSTDGTVEYSFYNLGRATFNTTDFADIQKTHYGVAEGDDIQNREGHEEGITVFACYTRTTGFNEISGNSIANPASITNGVYVPKHSYVIGQNADKTEANMYHTASDLKVKGFRGWIVDGDKTSQEAKFYLGGIFDEGEATSIGFIPADNVKNTLRDNAIYDMSGRKVGSVEDGNMLPKGIYIVNGKKFVIK